MHNNDVVLNEKFIEAGTQYFKENPKSPLGIIAKHLARQEAYGGYKELSPTPKQLAEVMADFW